MFLERPDMLMLAFPLAFLLGWIAATLLQRVRSVFRRRRQDPRDLRIRSLEADVRVANTATEKAKTALAETSGAMSELRAKLKNQDIALERQARTIEQLREDLKDSVRKTRALRTELAARASENIRSEVRLREVETELSIAHASTDMLTAGMLHSSSQKGRDDADD